MTQILACDMSSYAYNTNDLCRTRGINAGPHAERNTHIQGSSKGGFQEVNYSTGPGLALDCRFNERLECRASNISVAKQERHADGQTFQAKKLFLSGIKVIREYEPAFPRYAGGQSGEVREQRL